MARIPIVEQAWGQDELARVHRLVGFTSFNLMIAHIVLTILGYNAGTDLGLIGTFIDEVLHSPGMLLALAGTVALVMVVVTSRQDGPRRLRYESWHLLHLYAYLGAGLALPHQLWTGADFTASTVATVFWWGLYAAALASVVVFRVALPLIRSRRHRLVVSQVGPSRPRSHRSSSPGATSTGSRCGPGSSSSGASSTGRVVPRQPLQPLGRARRAAPADHGPGRRRLERPTGGPAARHPRARRGSLRPAARRGAHPRPLRAHRRRHRHHTPARPARGAAGRPDAAVVIYRVGRQADIVLADELLELARAKGARVVAVVGHRTDRDSWLPAESATSAMRRRCCDRPRPRPARRLRLRQPGLDGHRHRRRPRGRRAGGAVHHERFSY